MKTIRISWLSMLGLVGLVVPAALSGCDQTPPECIVGHAVAGDYVANLTVLNQSGCTDDQVRTLMTFGAEDYHPLLDDHTVDYTHTDVYLETADFQDVLAHQDCWSNPDPDSGYAGGEFHDQTHVQTLLLDGKEERLPLIWAVGSFDAITPDGEDFCHVSNFAPADQVTPAIPATSSSNPPPVCESPIAGCGKGAKADDCFCEDGTKTDCCVPLGNCAYPCGTDVDCCDPNDAACLADPPADACGSDQVCTLRPACSYNTDCTDPVGSGPGVCADRTTDATRCLTSAQPSTELKYAWNDVKFYTTASARGTQMAATLDYVNGSCQIKYEVNAVFPAVDCTLTDVDGNLIDSAGNPTNTPLPNKKACCPNPDPEHGHTLGAGIDPDYAVHCDPVSLLCVLDGPVPALNGNGTPNDCDPPTPVEQ